MSTSKHIDILSLTAIVLSAAIVIGCLVFAPTAAEGITMGYESRLFDTSTVHTIDIIMEDWEGFIETCENEEYALCSLVIDGESFRNVGIRGKGNTSLSSVSSMDSNRYSFKIEFDQYTTGGNYYGLDKLSLNNLIYDNTMMKDYLVYEMMRSFGAPAPLCSFVYITVNGEDFGLYLAIESIEDGFLRRNYGNDHGQLYKPDSMSFGGGRGNGRDFNMDDFMKDRDTEEVTQDNSQDFSNVPPSNRGQQPNLPTDFEMPENFDFSNMPAPGGGGGFGGMGSEDVKLQYIDDDPDSYSNIFSSAKTEITDEDKRTMITSLKNLTKGENIEETINIDHVMRYFVVHNYAVNGDSYTGSMIHNYYLYEKDGMLSMLPWDYNLAFGTFQGSNAQSSINDPIDTPLSTGSSDRPMIDWILEDEEYLALYHEYYTQFLNTVDIQQIIDHAYTIIDPYVEKDPTKFCTYEEFTLGVDALKTFCDLRSESITGQLNGSIPSTTEAQQENSSALINTASLNISDMGSMGGGMGGGDRRGKGQFEENGQGMHFGNEVSNPSSSSDSDEPVQNGTPPESMTMPENAAFPGKTKMTEDMTMPEDAAKPDNFQRGENSSRDRQLPFDEANSANPTERQAAFSSSDLLMIGGSTVLLIDAILLALFYRRRKR